MGPEPKSGFPVRRCSCCRWRLVSENCLGLDLLFVASLSCFEDAVFSQIPLQTLTALPFPALFVFLPGAVLCGSWSLPFVLLMLFICAESFDCLFRI